ncbi:MAG: NYN domain-containing protein [Lachnospiraceae bacterium]|nr:NYN domain-containing protein [Lachnospiraceae bacterium]
MSEWDFLWGLEGQELIDAMTSGGTYDDWAYIEEMERRQYGFDDDENDYYDAPSTKKNTMVFIDAENVAYSYATSIENEIWDIGNVAEVRYYAMQKDPSTAGWKAAIKEYGYKPILMVGEREKNKIDNKIIRDAKKVLNENKSIDIFVIVSRDGDYTELVRFLRSNRKRVVILAPKNTSKKLKNASSESRFINNRRKK